MCPNLNEYFGFCVKVKKKEILTLNELAMNWIDYSRSKSNWGENIAEYNWDLNTRQVQYSNSGNKSGLQIIQFSKGIWIPGHVVGIQITFESGPFFPAFISFCPFKAIQLPNTVKFGFQKFLDFGCPDIGSPLYLLYILLLGLIVIYQLLL